MYALTLKHIKSHQLINHADHSDTSCACHPITASTFDSAKVRDS